jgi:hypothetical protein
MPLGNNFVRPGRWSREDIIFLIGDELEGEEKTRAVDTLVIMKKKRVPISIQPSPVVNKQPPKHFRDMAFSEELMVDPVIAADGYVYERASIVWWLERHNISPTTSEELKHKNLTPDHSLRSAIQEWKARNPK